MANLINILFDHAGGKYDIQAEDLGAAAGEIDLRIYREGAIVFTKRISYRDHVAADAGSLEHDSQVRALMVKHIETLKKGIASGKLK